MAPLYLRRRGAGGQDMAPRGNQPEKIEGDTLVIMATFPTLDSETCTISASRIIDVRGEVAAYQQRVIEKVSGQGVMVKLTIPIYEVTA